MRVGSLFSGIGGLELGLERAGMRTIWQSETDAYASRVLNKHWPNVPNLGDITRIDWAGVERPDLVCGGFPCQPVSAAGRRLGNQDARWLWPEFARCLRDLRPRYALMENVPGLFTLGFGDVLADLAALGFDAEWGCIPAAAVGAPHLRWRVFIFAYPAGDGRCLGLPGESRREREEVGRGEFAVSDGSDRPLAYAQRDGVWEQPDRQPQRGSASEPVNNGPNRALAESQSQRCRTSGQGEDKARPAGSHGEPMGWPSVSRTERGQWSVEPNVGRVAPGVLSRVDRLRCLGNAVVPQVAEVVGRRIMAQA